MKIVNTTRGITLATHARVADNFWTRGRGLIGTRPLQPGEALIIRPCKGIHTWFMSYPIDVIYVDGQDQVLDLDPAVPPWRLGRPRRRARYVIELPASTIQRTGTQVGDQLEIVDEAEAQG
ncbi:MAG: DUF192 domain-containing protein [Chloroflexi bacterium]|nr:DUF192 domain-containing protein [Chloroflexota bacterium]